MIQAESETKGLETVERILEGGNKIDGVVPAVETETSAAAARLLALVS